MGKRMGRPKGTSLLEQDPGLGNRIAKHISRGNYIQTAAQAEGVSVPTLYVWFSRGEAGEEPFATFLELVTRARSQAELDILNELRNPPVNDEGKSDAAHLRSLQWILERTRRDKFGQEIQVRMRDEAARELIARLREGLDQTTFERCLGVLTGEGSSGILPATGSDSR